MLRIHTVAETEFKRVKRLVCSVMGRERISPGDYIEIGGKRYLILAVTLLSPHTLRLDVLSEEELPTGVAHVIHAEPSGPSFACDASQYIVAYARAQGFRLARPGEVKVAIVTTPQRLPRAELIVIAPSMSATAEVYTRFNELLRAAGVRVRFNISRPIVLGRARTTTGRLLVGRGSAYPLVLEGALPVVFSESGEVIGALADNVLVLASESLIMPLDVLDGVACENSKFLLDVLSGNVPRSARVEQHERVVRTVPAEAELSSVVDLAGVEPRRFITRTLEVLGGLGYSVAMRDDSLNRAVLLTPSGRVELRVEGTKLVMSAERAEALSDVKRVILVLLSDAQRASVVKERLKKALSLFLLFLEEYVKAVDYLHHMRDLDDFELRRLWPSAKLFVDKVLERALSLCRSRLAEVIREKVRAFESSGLRDRALLAEIESRLDELRRELYEHVIRMVEELP